jgi:hypothetical protein
MTLSTIRTALPALFLVTAVALPIEGCANLATAEGRGCELAANSPAAGAPGCLALTAGAAQGRHEVQVFGLPVHW